MNRFQERFAAVAVPRLINEFGERREDGNFESVFITLPRAQVAVEWPGAIVSKLTERTIERHGGLEMREACSIHGSTDALFSGATPLPELTTVVVSRYGESPFQIDPEQSVYGDSMTTLSLARVPVRSLGTFHESRSA